jgi:hypothetical protein
MTAIWNCALMSCTEKFAAKKPLKRVTLLFQLTRLELDWYFRRISGYCGRCGRGTKVSDMGWRNSFPSSDGVGIAQFVGIAIKYQLIFVSITSRRSYEIGWGLPHAPNGLVEEPPNCDLKNKRPLQRPLNRRSTQYFRTQPLRGTQFPQAALHFRNVEHTFLTVKSIDLRTNKNVKSVYLRWNAYHRFIIKSINQCGWWHKLTTNWKIYGDR